MSSETEKKHKQAELRFIRINKDRHLKILDRETKALPRYNEWRENNFDKTGRYMTILCFVYPPRRPDAAPHKDFLLGVTFINKQLYDKGIEIIRANKHDRPTKQE
jgi:hypothetical protein